MEQTFLKNYFKTLKDLIDIDSFNDDLINVKDILKSTHQEGKKQ